MNKKMEISDDIEKEKGNESNEDEIKENAVAR